MYRLGLALDATDLPLAELCAARLDGELVSVDEAFGVVDLPDHAAQRAQALGALAGFRLIAEQLSAAWIYGATRDAPARHRLCAPIDKRVYVTPSARVSVREVVIDNSEVRTIGGLVVTAPLRTVVDIVKASDTFDSVERTAVAAMMASFTLTPAECVARLNSVPHLPNKLRALDRITVAAATVATGNMSMR